MSGAEFGAPNNPDSPLALRAQHNSGYHKTKRLPDLIENLRFWTIVGCPTCTEKLSHVRPEFR